MLVAGHALEAVMAGSRGPVPKPAAQRRRNNKPEVPVTSAPAAAFGEVVVPDAPKADQSWHPIAREWFDSLARSGQSRFYEASDWATARLVAEGMHRLVTADKMSAQLFASILAGASSLLVTEGDRRRLRLELARGPKVDADEDASVTRMADYLAAVTDG